LAAWHEGVRLPPGEPDPVAKGTAIATFVDGRYPNNSTSQHAAIYLGQDETGIQVLDQWRGKAGGVTSRTIYWTGHVNRGDAFSMIE
jgi:hypothetical protein